VVVVLVVVYLMMGLLMRMVGGALSEIGGR
jgi:hypothetical protein